MKSYAEFLCGKLQCGGDHGFTPRGLPTYLYDFQAELAEWSLRKGRSAIFADCGLGKTPTQLVWADEVVRHTNRPVLIATPLAVSYQALREAEKFGIEAERCTDGKPRPGTRIVVTNYERLDRFDSSAFVGMVCDESSILKNFDGVRRGVAQEFMRRLPYRLLCTATAAPNDYTELGTSSEALGELGYVDMLTRFFRNQSNNSVDTKGRYRGFAAPRMYERKQWRFKGHAEEPFWRWVCSWARAIRRPSDLGYDDGPFQLPPLEESEHIVSVEQLPEGMLFALPVVGLKEQRGERRRSIRERCEKVADLINGHSQTLVWCHLNAEGDLLEKMIPDAEQVKGSDADEVKEEKLLGFANGEIARLVTKPRIGAWGLNLQRCSHLTFFPSHSYEQYYQGVRRCWRFGQEKPVRVDIVTTEGERGVMENLKRKAQQADEMFSALVRMMNRPLEIRKSAYGGEETLVPPWL